MSVRPSEKSVSPSRSPATRGGPLLRAVVAPIERFLAIEAAGGIVLLAAAVLALCWANSPWSASYEHLWHTRVAVSLGAATFAQSVHFWINDGLMVVFFFVAGLEIRREVHEGELADLRRATLPIAGAVGGMLVPAALFFALNRGLPSRVGWGVPMATDIAFAVGVLALLGKRVPPAMRVLLLALAIIDDIGAIIVVAVFYSSGVVLSGLGLVAGAAVAVRLFQKLGLTSVLAYGLPALVMWIGCLRAGIHPTVAGVILGLMTPPTAAAGQHEAPATRLQTLLHHWVAFGIMPLFALANAGVDLRSVSFGPTSWPLLGGVVVGFVLGKPLGVLFACWLVVRIGLARLPAGIGWREISVVGCVAGVGLTMAIFIAGLAFRDPGELGVAKLGVLLASALAGGLALLLGRFLLPETTAADAASSAAEAEASTEK